LDQNQHIYRKVRCVGQGTFGTVVIYRQCPTSNQVAVKLSRERLALHEANILEKIKDADPDKNNLLKLVEHFSLQYEHCIVTEKLDQDILHYMCQQSRRPMTVSEIRPIAQQLLVALKALKSMGLVHADIKPNNVMFVDHANYPFKVKLIDFGLARNTYKLCKLSEIQNVGYRAPEVVFGLPKNESVDMWSLGCNLAFMYLFRDLFMVTSEYDYIANDRLNIDRWSCDSLELQDEKEFKSLLKQMLCVNSRKRITPEEALRHDFITMKHLSKCRFHPYGIGPWSGCRHTRLDAKILRSFTAVAWL
uniref:Protein kinase domain-containing protein n=1 Tax=Oryzias melastigma TaxID=30732 RepID=A0A3B3C3K9_ORYME